MDHSFRNNGTIVPGDVLILKDDDGVPRRFTMTAATGEWVDAKYGYTMKGYYLGSTRIVLINGDYASIERKPEMTAEQKFNRLVKGLRSIQSAQVEASDLADALLREVSYTLTEALDDAVAYLTEKNGET